MRYHKINSALFTENRQRLMELLPPKSVVIVHANEVLPTNGDGTLPFKQNSNLFYLSGIDQEETVLIIAPDFPDQSRKEMLFLRETNEHIAVWEGQKLTKPQGTMHSGINSVYWKQDFEQVLSVVMAECDHVFLATNEHVRSDAGSEGANDKFITWCKQQYPLHQYHRLAPLVYGLRMVKSSKEIDLMQHACDITEKGFRRVLDAISPGVWEYELEAEYIHEFLTHRSRGFAYTPIIAGGINTCVLHYIDNSHQLRDGDLLLMDVGAEYANYNADMTRTVPVNGRFSPRQRAVYDAVMRIKAKATDLLEPGLTFATYNAEVGEIVTHELIELGLLDKTDVKNQPKDQPAYRKYFMHGTSHYLGLDVHDVGSTFLPLKSGVVLTVEPGLYIPEEKIGVRIEDNILVTQHGNKNLMKNIPIHAEEIEDLMNRK